MYHLFITLKNETPLPSSNMYIPFKIISFNNHVEPKMSAKHFEESS